MYWRIGSFPELQHLSDGERAELLDVCVGWRGATRNVVRSLAGGMILGVVAAGASAALAGNALFVASAFIIAWAVGTILAYQVYLIRFRGQLIIYLEQAAKTKRLPLCLNCGYNLTGLRDDRCPECGRRVSVTAQRTRESGEPPGR